jgi:GNAT superfamily N-acetyltransferase
MLFKMKFLKLWSFWQGLDGQPVERVVRALSTRDLPAYKAFISSLSAQSKYQRTLGAVVAPSEAQFDQLLSPKPPVEAVIGVFMGSVLVAVGRYTPAHENTTCEFAITVADAWQGMGLGTSLLKQLKVDAAKAGYEQMIAWVFSDNGGMLSLALSQSFEAHADMHDAGLQRLQCSLLLTSALLNARTPNTTPTINNAMPEVLSQPGIVDLHR